MKEPEKSLIYNKIFLGNGKFHFLHLKFDKFNSFLSEELVSKQSFKYHMNTYIFGYGCLKKRFYR